MIAGPNGSGKSTVTKKLELDATKIHIVNPDIFAKGLTHIEDTYERSMEAARQCQGLREHLLAQHVSFGFETVGSTEEKVEFVSRAKDAGYRVVLLFVTTSDPEINISRVADRVRRGGHDVPDDKVRRRYLNSMNLLHLYIDLADEAMVYDNSGISPEIALTKKDGEVRISTEFLDCGWVKEFILPWFGSEMA